jgi:hypothetical protein
MMHLSGDGGGIKYLPSLFKWHLSLCRDCLSPFRPPVSPLSISSLSKISRPADTPELLQDPFQTRGTLKIPSEYSTNPSDVKYSTYFFLEVRWNTFLYFVFGTTFDNTELGILLVMKCIKMRAQFVSLSVLSTDFNWAFYIVILQKKILFKDIKYYKYKYRFWWLKLNNGPGFL